MILKQQIEAAKQANLPSILKSLGVEIVPFGAGYHLTDHNSLKLFRQNSIWLYKWWSRNGEVGDDMRHCFMSFPEAVAVLSGSPPSENKATSIGQQQFQDHIANNKPQQWKTQKWQSAAKKSDALQTAYSVLR